LGLIELNGDDLRNEQLLERKRCLWHREADPHVMLEGSDTARRRDDGGR
jgi:ATP-dependent DNA ligase